MKLEPKLNREYNSKLDGLEYYSIIDFMRTMKNRAKLFALPV